jgi:2-polyprenyl-3-methyl-5-hydroxy-6-metoxy-1,4-benzoquinol methylase
MTSVGASEEAAGAADCPLCRAGPSRRLFRKRGIPYHRCPACGFVFSRPAANANFETTLDAYEPAYRAYLEDAPEDDANFATLLAWAEGFAPLAGRRVLDIGAGSGKLVRALRRRGHEAYGLEPARALHARFLAREPWFFAQTVEEFADSWTGGPFGAVFACDVIEHVERPDRFLAGVARLLEPGGLLFVTTPDVASRIARLSGRWWHYYNKYHLSYLSRRTLGTLAAGCGLRELGFTRLPRAKSVGYLAQYLADFALGRRGASGPGRLGGLQLTINLHDTMDVAFELRAPAPGAMAPVAPPAADAGAGASGYSGRK